MGAGGFTVGAGGLTAGVGAFGAVGAPGPGILPPSDCNKRFQNLASSCDKLSFVNVASPAEKTTAIVPNAIPACKKNFIVMFRNEREKIFAAHCLLGIFIFFETLIVPRAFLKL